MKQLEVKLGETVWKSKIQLVVYAILIPDVYWVINVFCVLKQKFFLGTEKKPKINLFSWKLSAFSRNNIFQNYQ